MDIDTDVSDRDKIIAYMQSKYGKESVCQIANFSYITPSVAITDSARVLDKIAARQEKFGRAIGVKTAREISKLFSYPTWKECIERNSFELEKYSDEIYKELFEVAEQLSGVIRHTAVHAGGVGVVDGKITDIMPMKNADGASVVMADKRMAEPLGIIKFDVLGLRSLSVIDDAVKLSGIDPWEIDPMNEDFLVDKDTYDLISNGDTDNVFQLESVSMSTLVKQVKPRDLATVSVCSSLMRPDTMAMLNDYIARRNGEQEITYLHEDMKPILEETLGVQAYQEQTLQIIRTFGGWSYGVADLFRRAVSKKIPEEIKRLVAELHGDIVANGYSEETAEQICGLLKDKGGYEFNKSHGVAYSLCSLQTAYLKAHHPVPFYTAVLNSIAKDNAKVNKNIIAAQKHGIEILPPHINNSESKFSIVDGKILFGLSAIKALGETVVEKIIAERKKNGLFCGVLDLTARCPELNTKQIIALIKGGAFGTDNKAELLEKYLKYITKQKFGSGEYKPYSDVKTCPTLLELKTKWGIDTKDKEERLRLYNEARRKEHETVGYEKWKSDRKEKMKKEYRSLYEKYCIDKDFWEYEALSIFLSNNPFSEIYSYIQRPFDAVEEGDEMFDVGIISSIQRKKDKRKATYAYFQLYTMSGLIEGICFSTAYNRFLNLIEKGNRVCVFGEKASDSTFVVKNIETIEDWLDRSNIKLKGR